MEKTWMYWTWGVWNDPKDPEFIEMIDCKERWGCGEGCSYSREGETLCWVEEYTCQIEWTWSCREIVIVLAKFEREDEAVEGNGQWA